MMTDNTRIELKKWKFCLDQTGYGEGDGWAGKYFDDSGWADVETCTCWENFEHGMRDYEGRGWFRTRFTPTEQNRRYVLHFEGIGGTAKVFVNGRLMGGTDNRYLPFDVDITLGVWTTGENVVAVLVDNSFRGPKHLPGGSNIEWVLYGGLNHRVWVEESKNFEVEHLVVDAAADGSAKVTVNRVKPVAAVILEGCPADDTFTESYAIQTALRKGPMFRHMDRSLVCNPRFQRFVLDLAREKGLPVQESVRSGGGNNAAAVQTEHLGAPAVVAGVPVRYVHAPNCMATGFDLEATVQVVVEILKTLTPERIASF